MKFSTVTKGTRAEKAIELPPPDGSEKGVPTMLRALNGVEEGVALKETREYCKAQGIAEPKTGEPIYDLALMVETIRLACLDPESPLGAREPLFDQGADQIRGAYGREAIAYIYELQQDWQDEVSPSIKKLDVKAYIDTLFKMGGPDEEEARTFFIQSVPGLRWSLTRTMAVQLVSLLSAKSESGSNSEPATATSKKKVVGSPKSKRN